MRKIKVVYWPSTSMTGNKIAGRPVRQVQKSRNI